jgi:glycosyltransferase involved in cell wall biosynthesis
MPKLSVMNLTNRPGGIDILWANMLRQSEQDFELVIVDALWRDREEEVKAYINDPRLVYVRQSDKREGAYTNLAHADNDGFRACTGELIVCLQDYIWISPDALSKFWEAHKAYGGKILITGVGDQYAYPGKDEIVKPQGKVTVFERPYTRRPEDKCWADPRKRTDLGSFYACNAPSWELNWAAIPKDMIFELGGMDEQYDYKGFAWDNVNIAQRAEMLGYVCYIDQTNECMGFDHDGWWPNPLKVERVSPMEYHQDQMARMLKGELSPRLNFLA